MEFNPDSPYAFTPILDNRFLDIMVYRPIPPAEDDLFFVVDNQMFVHRPDLISYSLYGTPNLWWVFGVRNELEDPVHDIEIGLVLAAPHPDRIRKLL